MQHDDASVAATSYLAPFASGIVLAPPVLSPSPSAQQALLSALSAPAAQDSDLVSLNARLQLRLTRGGVRAVLRHALIEGNISEETAAYILERGCRLDALREEDSEAVATRELATKVMTTLLMRRPSMAAMMPELPNVEAELARTYTELARANAEITRLHAELARAQEEVDSLHQRPQLAAGGPGCPPPSQTPPPPPTPATPAAPPSGRSAQPAAPGSRRGAYGPRPRPFPLRSATDKQAESVHKATRKLRAKLWKAAGRDRSAMVANMVLSKAFGEKRRLLTAHREGVQKKRAERVRRYILRKELSKVTAEGARVALDETGAPTAVFGAINKMLRDVKTSRRRGARVP